jgi:hypothetical protein
LQSCFWSIDHVFPHRSEYSRYTATVEKWVEILALAQKWGFKEVEQLCIRQLESLPISPVEKINIYQACHLDRSLLVDSFEELTLRPEPLTLEDVHKLGMETAIQIARARELSRGSNPDTKLSTIQMNDSELRSVIQDVFGVRRTVVYEDLTDVFLLSLFEDESITAPATSPTCDYPKVNRKL